MHNPPSHRAETDTQRLGKLWKKKKNSCADLVQIFVDRTESSAMCFWVLCFWLLVPTDRWSEIKMIDDGSGDQGRHSEGHPLSTSFLGGWLPGKRMWATLPAARRAWRLLTVFIWSAVRLITSVYIVTLSLNLMVALKSLGTTCAVRGCTTGQNRIFYKTNKLEWMNEYRGQSFTSIS